MPYKDFKKKREYNRQWAQNKRKKIKTHITMDNMNNYPIIKIPENMRETQYPGYYITNDGKAYRKPGKYDYSREINQYGLIHLKPGFRGVAGHQYECINISIRDENGKYLKQIKKSIHQLVAEEFCERKDNENEVDHIDRDKRNNHYTNLRWCTRETNMKNKEFSSYVITDLITGQIWKGENLMGWAKENFNIVHPRLRTKTRGWEYVGKNLITARAKKHNIWKFKVEY